MIIENVASYVRSIWEVVPIGGSPAAIDALHAEGMRIVIVSNQSMVGRRLVASGVAERIQQHVVDLVTSHRDAIRASYLCVHAPNDGCRCRKPGPGLLEQASEELGIELESSVLIGDAMTDVEAARAVGAAAILVATGRGTSQRPAGPADGWIDAADLADATRMLLEGSSPR